MCLSQLFLLFNHFIIRFANTSYIIFIIKCIGLEKSRCHKINVFLPYDDKNFSMKLKNSSTLSGRVFVGYAEKSLKLNTISIMLFSLLIILKDFYTL